MCAVGENFLIQMQLTLIESIEHFQEGPFGGADMRE